MDSLGPPLYEWRVNLQKITDTSKKLSFPSPTSILNALFLFGLVWVLVIVLVFRDKVVLHLAVLELAQ